MYGCGRPKHAISKAILQCTFACRPAVLPYTNLSMKLFCNLSSCAHYMTQIIPPFNSMAKIASMVCQWYD